jgi:hypothetical protein
MPALARTHLALPIHRTAQSAPTRALRPQLKIHTFPTQRPSAPVLPRPALDNKGTTDADTNELSCDELIWGSAEMSPSPNTISQRGVSGTMSFPSPVKRLSPMFWRL